MFKAYLKVMVGLDHDITKIRSIVARYDPKIIVLESKSPATNNRVIRYAQHFEKNGWRKMKIKLKTRCKSTGKGTEFHIISVMLKQSSYEAEAEEIKKL